MFACANGPFNNLPLLVIGVQLKIVRWAIESNMNGENLRSNFGTIIYVGKATDYGCQMFLLCQVVSSTERRGTGNGNRFAISGPSMRLDWFTSSQSCQLLRTQTGARGFFSAEDRRPPFGGDIVALAPLRHAGDRSPDIGRHCLSRGPEFDDRAE